MTANVINEEKLISVTCIKIERIIMLILSQVASFIVIIILLHPFCQLKNFNELHFVELTSSSRLMLSGWTPRGTGIACPLGSGLARSDFSVAFLLPKNEGNEGRVGSSGNLRPRKFAIPLPPACLASPSSSSVASASAARAL